MFGVVRDIGWRNAIRLAKRLATLLATVESHRRCDVIDLDDEPHWLYRDIGMRDGRPTRQELRSPPKWPGSL